VRKYDEHIASSAGEAWREIGKVRLIEESRTRSLVADWPIVYARGSPRDGTRSFGSMISRYVCNVCRFKRWKILLFVGVCALLLNVVPRSLHPSVTQLTEVHKCPACYGVSACRDVHRVELLWHDSRAIFSHLFGVKNVFYGTYDRRKVVLKKLAHSSELDAFDAVLCEKLGSRAPCFDLSIDRRTADFYLDLIETTIAPDFSKDDSSRLRFCPTVRRLGDLLHDVYLNDEDVQDTTESLINLWTLVSINPEPLILQVNRVEMLPSRKGVGKTNRCRLPISRRLIASFFRYCPPTTDGPYRNTSEHAAESSSRSMSADHFPIIATNLGFEERE